MSKASPGNNSNSSDFANTRLPSSSFFHYLNDHNYCVDESPRNLKRKLLCVVDKYSIIVKKLKNAKQTLTRAKTTIKSLSSVVDRLRAENLVSAVSADRLQETFSGVPLAVMQRITSYRNKKICRKKYPPELRAFALTLQFYSTKAYNFVRKHFNLALPHPAAIRRWYQSINGQPGFTAEAFIALSARVEEAKKTGHGIICSLMIDEMAIRKHVQWDGSKYLGYVDLGTGMIDDSSPIAADALVFMAVALNGHWKLPCGYFLINGLSGEERSNLVKQCLMKLNDVGVNIVSLTCDGPSCHFSMINHLGASLDPSSLNSSFCHPSDATQKVYVILDICHMLKLIRNAWGEGGILLDFEGNKIRWSYIVELQKLQDTEGFHLGNKLRQGHVKFHTQKMKVNLAAQTLSSSVAHAIEFCCTNLKFSQFQGSEATVKFIRIFDHLFDILNSRNPFAKGFKAAMRPSNLHIWGPFLDEAFSYISGLRDTNGLLMTQSRRKTAFVGFLASIQSVKALFVTLVDGASAPLKYLLTYKFSQDHIELFFAAVRSSFGSNNNPTVRQFIAAYKRLLVRNEIQGVGGNAIAIDKTNILFVTCNYVSIKSVHTDISDLSLIRRYDMIERMPSKIDHDYCDLANSFTLSTYKEYVVAYIAGYVVRMARRELSCSNCLKSLCTESSTITVTNPKLLFVEFRDKGGLVKPSSSVILVCEASEKCLQRILNCNNGKLPKNVGTNFVSNICVAVLGEVGQKSIFEQLTEHMFDSTPECNHIFNVIKVITHCYIKVRMHALARTFTENETGIKIRKKLSKLILFKHQ